MKKTIILSIFSVLLLTFSIVFIVFSVQDANYFHERYVLHSNYVNDYKDTIEISADTIQSITATAKAYNSYYLKNVCVAILASISAILSMVILLSALPNILNHIKTSQTYEIKKQIKAQHKEERKAQRIAALEKELNELKKDGE